MSTDGNTHNKMNGYLISERIIRVINVILSSFFKEKVD